MERLSDMMRNYVMGASIYIYVNMGKHEEQGEWYGHTTLPTIAFHTQPYLYDTSIFYQIAIYLNVVWEVKYVYVDDIELVDGSY